MDMGKTAAFSGFRCSHCGSTETLKCGFYKERQRYHCRACQRKSIEVQRYPVSLNIRCYHCGSMETSKAGFHKEKQRYFCSACKRGFRESPAYIKGRGEKRNFWVRKKLPSAGHLILELRAIAQNVLRRTPQTADIGELSKKRRSNSLNTYRAVFGTFSEALRRARLTPDYPRQYPPEQMIEELRALRRKLGRPLLKRDIAAACKKGKAPSFYFLRREFGSILKALEAAGAGRKPYSREEMIDCLRKLDARLERPVRRRDINELYRAGKGPSSKTVYKMFGGMTKVRLAAGIKRRKPQPVVEVVAPRPKYTAEILIAQFQALAKKLGRPPSARDIAKASKLGLCAGLTTYQTTIGGMPEVRRRAGIEEINYARYTDEEILVALKKLKEELGRFPTDHDLRNGSKAGKCPDPKTVFSRLGNMSEVRSLLRTDASDGKP